jgi:hypothetical protein
MSAEQRLAELAESLKEVGLDALVMGGHAVRYYGVDRNTVDFDFYTAVESTAHVRARLAGSALLKSAREGPSWRPEDFARFEVGKLADGREEWLEFWVRNHLLASFAEVRARQERGSYGGREVAFISLSDLLDSKETERESDWQDIMLLEEIQDSRNLAAASTDDAKGLALSRLRSRRGFERAVAMSLFSDGAAVRGAVAKCQQPVSLGFLLPLVPDVAKPPDLRAPIDDALLAPLRKVEFGGSKHLSLVEVMRRAYKRWAMEKDRRDKQTSLRTPKAPSP